MIVTAGENLIDMIQGADGNYQPVPGGSPYNIAIALARLGVPVGYATPISHDALGDKLIARFDENCVKYLPANRADRPTGLACVTISQDGQPQYGFYRVGAADTDWLLSDVPSLDSDCELLHIGGSPALGHPVCGSNITNWALAQSQPLSIDPNVRPALIEDKTKFLERCDQLCEQCVIFRLSDEDAEYMYGSTNPEQLTQKLLDKGVSLAVVTLGANGAYLATANNSAKVAGLEVKTVDTIGAGDTFFAALLMGLRTNCGFAKDAVSKLTEEQLQAVGQQATQAAAINCSRTGCNPPTADELNNAIIN